MLVDPEAGLFSSQAVRLQFIECAVDTIHLKETTFLARVASILGQAYLNIVSLEHCNR